MHCWKSQILSTESSAIYTPVPLLSLSGHSNIGWGVLGVLDVTAGNKSFGEQQKGARLLVQLRGDAIICPIGNSRTGEINKCFLLWCRHQCGSAAWRCGGKWFVFLHFLLGKPRWNKQRLRLLSCSELEKVSPPSFQINHNSFRFIDLQTDEATCSLRSQVILVFARNSALLH